MLKMLRWLNKYKIKGSILSFRCKTRNFIIGRNNSTDEKYYAIENKGENGIVKNGKHGKL